MGSKGSEEKRLREWSVASEEERDEYIRILKYYLGDKTFVRGPNDVSIKKPRIKNEVLRGIVLLFGFGVAIFLVMTVLGAILTYLHGTFDELVSAVCLAIPFWVIVFAVFVHLTNYKKTSLTSHELSQYAKRYRKEMNED